MKYGCVRLFKCEKNSKDDERESFKFNEYNHRASYKLLKTLYNTENLGFKDIKTNKPTSARGRHFEEEQFKQIIETKYASFMSYHYFYFYVN